MPVNEAKISVLDRSFLFGEGIFSTVRVFQGKAEHLDRHWKRIQKQCAVLDLQVPKFSFFWIDQLITANGAGKGIWRLKLIVTGGVSDSEMGTFIALMEPYTPPVSKVLSLTVYPYPVTYPSSQIKSLAYLERHLLFRYAKEKGADDCLVLDAQGRVLETAFANVFLRNVNGIITPPSSLSLMPGIALELEKERIVASGGQVEERAIYLDELEQADLWLCNCLRGYVPAKLLS